MGRNFCGQKFFVALIFAEFIFEIWSLNCKIKFRETSKISSDCENKFCKTQYIVVQANEHPKNVEICPLLVEVAYSKTLKDVKKRK